MFENIIVIGVFVAFVTCGMVGYSYKKQMDNINSPINQKSQHLNEIITQNHDSFYHMNDVKQYTDADQPSGTYNVNVRLFVDYNFDSIEGNTNLDYSQMITRLQADTLIFLTRDTVLQKIISDLNLNSYDEMSDLTVDDLRWMINKNFLGANILQIVVSDVDPERAKNIAEAITNEFLQNAAELPTIDKVEVLDSAESATASYSSGVQTSINKKSLINYAIVGFGGSLLLISFLYFILFIVKDCIRTMSDVSFAGVKYFGKISCKETQRKEDIKRIALCLSQLKKNSKILIVPVEKKSEDIREFDELKDELLSLTKDITIAYSNNICGCADATKEILDSDEIILTTTYGKTRMSDLQFAKTEIEKVEKPIIGTIINKTRF